jgi:hypothetical protein
MAALPITLGLLFGLFGGWNLLHAIVENDLATAIGVATVGIVLLIPGLLMFIYGVRGGGVSRRLRGIRESVRSAPR